MAHEAGFDELEHGQQAAEPAVAVGVGVDRLELVVADGYADQEGQVLAVDPPFPVRQQVDQAIGWWGDEDGLVDPAVGIADPVLGLADAPSGPRRGAGPGRD